MCKRACCSAHVCHAHVRTAGLESGGDYLFNISAASGVVESVAPRAAIDRRAAALGMRMLSCSRMPFAHGLTGCGMLLSARGFRQLGWRVASGKSRTELLPRSQRSVVCCRSVSSARYMSGESRTVHCSCTTVIGCKTCMGMGLVVLVSCLSFCYTEFLYSLRHPRRHDPSP